MTEAILDCLSRYFFYRSLEVMILMIHLSYLS